jgi:hypothetical protein
MAAPEQARSAALTDHDERPNHLDARGAGREA